MIRTPKRQAVGSNPAGCATLHDCEIMKALPEISQITLERTLHEMLTKDEVEKIGGGRYTKYRKKE